MTRPPAARALAALLCGPLAFGGCGHIQVTLPPGADVPAKRLRVAVIPFDDKTGSGEPVGEMAAAYFTQELLKFPQYQVTGESVAERTVRVQSTIESTGDRKRSTDKIEVVAFEKGQDPLAWGRKHGVDAVLAGSVTRYRRRNAFILPPAAVSIEARLIHVKSRQVLWAVSDSRGYGAWKWVVSIFWPVGVILAAGSPHAQDKLRESAKKSAEAVRERLEASAAAK